MQYCKQWLILLSLLNLPVALACVYGASLHPIEAEPTKKKVVATQNEYTGASKSCPISYFTRHKDRKSKILHTSQAVASPKAIGAPKESKAELIGSMFEEEVSAHIARNTHNSKDASAELPKPSASSWIQFISSYFKCDTHNCCDGCSDCFNGDGGCGHWDDMDD